MLAEVTQAEIKKFVDSFEMELLASTRYKIDFNTRWFDTVSKSAGIYAIFDKDEVIYIGETANLRERMKELRRTYNHSFRKKLGKKLQEEAVIIKGKFPEELEISLHQYCNDNISVAVKELLFGRLEVESYLIHKHKESLLNTAGKRGVII